jgi:hypothetical protein
MRPYEGIAIKDKAGFTVLSTALEAWKALSQTDELSFCKPAA